MKSQEVLPVIISIIAIILVAVLQKQSKVIAAIVSTTPLRVTFAMWIIYAAVNGDKREMTQFSQSVIFSLIPTFIFAVAAWIASRAGMKLGGILLTGYGSWAIAAGILYLLRKTLGLG